jgi:hypothetical protein
MVPVVDMGPLLLWYKHSSRRLLLLHFYIRINRAHEQKHRCEFLFAEGRIYDAAESLLEIANTVSEDMDMRGNKLMVDWLAGEFRRRTLG